MALKIEALQDGAVATMPALVPAAHLPTHHVYTPERVQTNSTKIVLLWVISHAGYVEPPCSEAVYLCITILWQEQ